MKHSKRKRIAGLVVAVLMAGCSKPAPQGEPNPGSEPKRGAKDKTLLDEWRASQPPPDKPSAAFTSRTIGDARFKHWTQITCICFTKDGRRIASGSYGGVIVVWDAKTGKRLHSIQEEESIRTLCFSPDGQHLAFASGSGFSSVVKLRNLKTGKVLLKQKETETGVRAIRFSPKGKVLVWSASAISRGSIRFWDIKAHREIRTIKAKTFSTDLSPDGKYVASASRTVKIWDVATGNLVRELKGTRKS